MNLNPKSPFSDRHLADLTGEHVREGDAWAAQLLRFRDVAYINFLHDWQFVATKEEDLLPVPKYHELWAVAGPLMERAEMYLELFGALKVNAIEHMESTRSHYRRSHLRPVDVRNHFIIAATHAASIAAGKE